MTVSSAQRRLRRALAQGAHRVLDRVEPAPRQEPPAQPAWPSGVSWDRPLPDTLGVEEGGATARLLARLPDEMVAEVARLIAEDSFNARDYAKAWPVEQRRLLLSLGMHYGVEGLAERAGLVDEQPPEDVHAMARGPLAAAGGLYDADFVVDALSGAGVRFDEVHAALDFGCSSGRVLRVLASAFPEVDWQGCDPNGAAIAWARRAIPSASFFVSGDEPPLELPDASLGLVYAISIWSHFAPTLGLCWLEEMRRVLRPGGCLLLTTHGFTTTTHDVENGRRPAGQADEIKAALAERGAWYHAEFGEAGDWGVVNPDWGTAFLSAEWLLAHACPAWEVLDFAPGRNGGNQDLWLLRRV